MLDDPQHWPEGAGLYCTMNAGDVTENAPRFQLQPLTNENDDIEALAINIMGFRFMLMLTSKVRFGNGDVRGSGSTAFGILVTKSGSCYPPDIIS
jgi:hypothetical protein